MSLASHRIIQYIAIILILALFGGGYYQWRKSRAAVQVNQGLEDSLGQGLAGYWKLDDGSGTTAVDSSGNGNNGTFVNSPTWSTSGQVGGALSFDGANDYVTVPYSSSLVSTDKLSYSFWIKPDLNEGTGILGALNGEDGSGYNFIAIDNNGTELNNPSIGIGRTIGGSFMGRSVSFASPTNTWIHGVYTYDGSVERWYINGSKLGEWAQSGAFATNTEAGLLLGINYSTASSGYKGLMDEVRVYNRALSADEASRLYQTTAPTGIDTGLVGYWPFDGDAISGTTAYDRSGNGNDGTLTNGPTLTEGKSGQALKFDGVNDSVNAGSATSLDDLSALTVSAWIYPRTSTYGPAGTLVLKGSGSSYPSGPSTFYNGWFAGFIATNPTQFQFGVKYSTANLYKNASSSAFTMNEWQYVTVTWDGTTSAGGIKMYRNGVEVSYGVSQDGSGSHVTDASSDLVMGINNYGEGNLVGSLDEVRIYNRALSAAEIINLYQKTQSDSVNAANKYDSLALGLAGYWKLDDGSGTTATDSSSNGNNMTLINGPTWTTGHIQGATSLDGTDDYGTVPYNSVLTSTTNLTYSIWVKPDLNDGIGFLGALNGKESSSYNFLNVDNSGTELNNPLVSISRNINGSTAVRSISFSSLTNQWFHYVYTYDGVNERAYANGVKLGEWAQTGNFATSTDFGLVLGKSYSTYPTPFKGSLDEVRVYNRALSDLEISHLYRTTAPTGIDTGLVGYWPFDGKDISGTTTYDRSGKGNNGTLTNGPTAVRGNLGQALSFDGVDDYITTPSIALTGDFTYSTWVYLKGNGGGSYNDLISCGSSAYRQLYILNSTNVLSFYDGSAHSSGYAIPLNQWTYITFTLSGTTMTFWVNGVSVSTQTLAVAGATGVFNIGGIAGNILNGSIDEVRIYSRALSIAEIRDLYDYGKEDKINTAASDPLTDGLAGYWKLDDGSGTTATDSSGNSNNGTLTNGPTWTTGQVQGATSFDGTNDYITAGAPAALNITQAISISAWIYPTGWGGGSKGRIVDKDAAASAGYVFFIDNANVSQGLSYGVNSAGFPSSSTGLSSSANAITLNTWQYVTASFDGTSVTLYVNGVAVGSGAMFAPSTSSENFVIGGKTTANDRNFPGYIDEIRVYNRALSEDEVKRLYRTTAPSGVDTGLVGYWPFDGDDISGTTAYDRSSKGNRGTLTNGPVPTIGKIGQAISFDGTDDYITSGAASALNITGPFTMSAWIYPTAYGGGSRGRIFDKVNLTSTGYAFFIDNFGASNGLSVVINGGVTGTANYRSANNVITLNTWQYVTASFDGTNIYFYVNGIPATGAQTFNTPASGSENFAVGGRTASNDRNFSGSIDEPRIYNRALSAAEIANLYNKGK